MNTNWFEDLFIDEAKAALENRGNSAGDSSGGVEINNQDKTITENGTYTADAGYTGLGTVEVNVQAEGGDTTDEDGLITRKLTEYSNDRVTSIGSYAFYSNYSITAVAFPAVSYIDKEAFYNCTRLSNISFPVLFTTESSAFCSCAALTTVNLPCLIKINTSVFYKCISLSDVDCPSAEHIYGSAFGSCNNLTTTSFPKVTFIDKRAFRDCYKLSALSFPMAARIASSAFEYCSALTELHLMNSTRCNLDASNAFYSAGITSTTGSIYVPASLLTSYQTATNWAYFSTQFVAGD